MINKINFFYFKTGNVLNLFFSSSSEFANNGTHSLWIVRGGTIIFCTRVLNRPDLHVRRNPTQYKHACLSQNLNPTPFFSTSRRPNYYTSMHWAYNAEAIFINTIKIRKLVKLHYVSFQLRWSILYNEIN